MTKLLCKTIILSLLTHAMIKAIEPPHVTTQNMLIVCAMRREIDQFCQSARKNPTMQHVTHINSSNQKN